MRVEVERWHPWRHDEREGTRACPYCGSLQGRNTEESD